MGWGREQILWGLVGFILSVMEAVSVWILREANGKKALNMESYGGDVCEG